MFDSLSDRMKEDENKEVNTTEKAIRWVVVTIVSLLVFGGLYFSVRLLE